MAESATLPGEGRVLDAAANGEASVVGANQDDDGVLVTQLTKEESFKTVKTTDAEGAVHNFAHSPLIHKLRRVFDTFDIDKNGVASSAD